LQLKLDFSVCGLGAVRSSVCGFGLCLLSLCGAFQHGLWCVSAWFVVRLDVGFCVTFAQVDGAQREKEFQKKKMLLPFSLLLS
jgi:hypothetical protein